MSPPSLPTSPQPIAFLDLTLPAVQANLALDEALLIEADEGRGGAVLRAWEQDAFAVVLGASRRIDRDVDLEACRADGVPVARRSSGGGTVVIGPGALNLTVVLPSGYAPGLNAIDTAQRFVLDRTAAALRDAGIPAEVLGSGDLTRGGRKFAGSAQRRLKSWFLVHTSLLHDFPLDRVARYLRQPDRQPEYRQGRSHDEFLMNAGLPRRIILEKIRSIWCSCSPLPPATDVPPDLLRSLLSDRFADPSWIARL